MFDPIKLAEAVKKIVTKNDQRKYYRFRAAHFYGGIATADCVGCNLRCAFCWAWNVVNNPQKIGKFYSPEEVVARLTATAEEKGFSKIRISGNEPTLAKSHLFAVLDLLPKNLLFILETNGIMIGHDDDYAYKLAAYKNVHVRVALKGSSPEEFSQLTGGIPEAYNSQIRALEMLESAGVEYHPAIMTFQKDYSYILKRLEEINPSLPLRLEYETLIPYPAVRARLQKIKVEI